VTLNSADTPAPLAAATPRRASRPMWFASPAIWALGALALIVIIGPWLSPYGEVQQNLAEAFAHPNRAHWFGQDALGRDLLTRVLYGGRISLAVGLAGALVSLLIGVSIGAVAGYCGGLTERLIMRGIDILYGVPLLLVVIGLMVLLQPGLQNVFIALGLVYWLEMARVVRARVAELRRREFVLALRALGAGPLRIIFRHMLPNTAGVVIVTATFMVPQAIFAESFLSFLGLGVTVPQASWGTLAAEGLDAMRAHPHALIFPAAAICLTMLLFQIAGERLRVALDPRED
jgi:oligopeptide transport system permease protein